MAQSHSTTILTVRHRDVVAIGGDGQVTVGNTIMKADAVKIRRLNDQKVITGIAARRPTPSPCWSGLDQAQGLPGKHASRRYRIGQGMADR